MRKTKSRKRQQECLYGILPVQQALITKSRTFQELWVKEGKASERLHNLIANAKKLKIPVRRVPKKELEMQCSGGLHQGVMLKCSPLEYSQSEPWKNKTQLLVVLDQVEDPHNLGAVIRSCAFFEAAALILPKDHAISLSPVVSKASAGTAEFFPVITVSNLSRFLKQRQDQGYWVVGLDGAASKSLTELQNDRPLILVLGNEGKGIRPLTQKTCDWLVHIPGNPKVSSLNVSNAAAISLYHLYKAVF